VCRGGGKERVEATDIGHVPFHTFLPLAPFPGPFPRPGRKSGSIAMQASLASSCVDICLVAESRFELEVSLLQPQSLSPGPRHVSVQLT
jgi:hypothetical protein